MAFAVSGYILDHPKKVLGSISSHVPVPKFPVSRFTEQLAWNGIVRTIRSMAVHFFLGLSKLRIFCLGRDEDGNVGVGVFPEREEILIRGARLSAVALQRVGAGKSQSHQCAPWKVHHHSAIIDEFLKFGSGPVTIDELGTQKLFKSMLGKVYTVRGVDKYGTSNLNPND
jgi:hypothetical protein